MFLSLKYFWIWVVTFFIFFGEIKKITEKFSLEIFWKSCSICNFFSGKKPQKKKLLEKPLAEIEVVAADGPGTGNISILFLMHSFIRILPGSEIVGVPASEITEIILFSFNKFKTFLMFFFR